MTLKRTSSSFYQTGAKTQSETKQEEAKNTESLQNIVEAKQEEVAETLETVDEGITENDKKRIAEMEKEHPGWWERVGREKIKFYPNAIEVNGIKFARENMKATANNKDIFQGYDGGKAFPDEYYFKWDAAMRESKKQWKKIPTKEQWEQAMKIFPGYKHGERCEAGKHLYGLLGLKLSSCRYSNGSRYNESEFGYCRSGSEIGTESACHFIFNSGKGMLDRDYRGYSFPVRPVED